MLINTFETEFIVCPASEQMTCMNLNSISYIPLPLIDK